MNDTATVAHAVSGADYATVTAASVAVTVADDETVSTVVALSVAPATLSESDGGDGTVTVTATLNQAPRDVATVLTLSVGESSDTAVEGTDYATVEEFLVDDQRQPDHRHGNVSVEPHRRRPGRRRRKPDESTAAVTGLSGDGGVGDDQRRRHGRE